MTKSVIRKPRASRSRIPVSANTAKSSRSRRLPRHSPQPSRMVWICLEKAAQHSTGADTPQAVSAPAHAPEWFVAFVTPR
jgi:hypothetical protein